MIPEPISPGLTVCEQVITDVETERVSLINGFDTFVADEFPFVPLPFCVFGSLTGGKGQGEVTLAIITADTDEEVYSLQQQVTFPDRFTEVQILARLDNVAFPGPGEYLFLLAVDGDWVTHRRIQVQQQENDE